MAERDEPVYVCRCEEVTAEEIEEAMRDGATTIAGVKKRTHAGMGLCQGRTCRRLIAAMLCRDGDPAAVSPATFRPPVRAMTVADIAAGDEE